MRPALVQPPYRTPTTTLSHVLSAFHTITLPLTQAHIIHCDQVHLAQMRHPCALRAPDCANKARSPEPFAQAGSFPLIETLQTRRQQVMRNRRVRMKQFLLFAATDLVGILLGLTGAYFLRFSVEIIEVTKGYEPEDYTGLLPLALLVWVFWLDTVGGYRFRERAFNLQLLKKIWHANVLSVMTIVCIHFFTRSTEYSRAIYPLALVTTTCAMALSRLALDRTLAHLRRSGQLPRSSVLILGANTLGSTIAKRIRKHAYLGLKVVGFVSVKPDRVGHKMAGIPVVADFAHIFEAVRRLGVGEVIVAQPDLPPHEILEFMLECEKEFVTARIVPNLLEASLMEMSVEQIDGIPLFGLKESPLQGWNIVVKRTLDVLVSAGVFVIFLPLFFLIALAIKLTSPGPVLYRQTRIGLDGHQFSMLKFRSMRADAEQQTGPVWTVPEDCRVTPVGRFLRRTNLDELPQFWNVLVGDMSLVGPRPERPHFVDQFQEKVPRYMGRHRVKSGMTGWAQVNGLRGNTSIDERIKYDLYYVENWSIWLDLKILFMTFGAMENAY